MKDCNMSEKFYAAIDLGTNSCRLLIVNQKGQIVYQDSKPTRLGEAMQAQMKLTSEACGRGLKCFEEYKQILDKYNIVKIRAIATEACRAAKNAREFMRQVYEKTNINIEVVTPQEEARLNLLGAISHVRGKKTYVVIVDLGGGSTEIVVATNSEKPNIINTVSIPWGSRTASDAFKLETYDENNAQKLREEIARWVEGFKRSVNYEGFKSDIGIIGTSSTPLRLASIIKKYEVYNREKCDGIKIKNTEITEVLESLKTMTQKEMAENPNIGENRSHIFVPAVIMLKEIFDGLEAKEIVTSLRSAKNGIVEELIKNDKTNKISQRSAWPKNVDR